METIEQLKQDNTKLQERLNNAAKFFREQKAQIEELTKENNELKHEADCFNSLQESYENDIKSKDQALKVLQDTYNEVFAENKQLKDQVASCEFNTESDANNLEDLNKQLNEYELKLQNSEAAYEMLRKKYEERKNQIAELLGNIEAKNNEYNELKKLHDEDLTRYNELEDNYEGLQNKYKENDIARGEAELRLENIQIEYTNKFDEQNKEIEELKQKINSQQAQYNTLKEHNEAVISDRNEIKEKLEKFNQSFVNCENERLCLEDDYRKLNEKYESLVIQASVNEENAAKYEEIREDYEKYKEFINALHTKAKEVNIVWASPDEITKQEAPKKENNNKPIQKQNKEGRVINQEMNVQGMGIVI